MASGKLSPRQKMINMMYLVLLALLALNVSKEVLDAFDIIRGKLNKSAVTANDNADAFMANMKETINEEIENENKRINEGLLDSLDIIKSRTNEMIGKINDHIGQMEQIAGIDPETGELERKDEIEANYQYWMGNNDASNGGRGNGEAAQLKDEINEYFAFIHEIEKINTKDPQARAALEPTTLPDKMEGKGGQVKSWERYHFDGPVVGNIAILEAFKSDIYEEQKELLDLLNSRLGVATFKVDKVIPLNSPVSTIVPAGLQFQTKLAVAMSSSTLKPSFNSSSGSIERQDDGTAMLTISANGGVIPKGKSEGVQSYAATIQVPKATGGFETLPVEGQFTVRKPEVQITSAAIQNMYRNCANDVNIDVPALGDFYNPKVSASSAQVITTPEDRRLFRIIPTGNQCVVSVANVLNGQTTKIDDVVYKVIEPPKPTIDFAINGQRTDGSTPVPKGSRVQVRLVPDEDFKAALPRDARYGITGINVKAQLSLGPPQTVNTVGGSSDATQPITVSLGSRVQQAPSNTKIYIEIEDIYRTNFQGKRIPDKRFYAAEKIRSFVVK